MSFGIVITQELLDELGLPTEASADQIIDRIYALEPTYKKDFLRRYGSEVDETPGAEVEGEETEAEE